MLSALLYHLAEAEKIISNSAKGDAKDQELHHEAKERFQSMLAKAPLEWKAGYQDPAPVQPRDRLKIASWSKDPITVPEDILNQLKIWDADPSSFFHIEARDSLSGNPITRMYCLLENISGGIEAIKGVHLRLAKIGFSRLKTRLSLRREVWADPEDELVQRIQIAGDETKAKKARTWLREGDRLDSLSDAFKGIGWAICKPRDISDYK